MLLSVIRNVCQVDASVETATSIILVQFAQYAESRLVSFRTVTLLKEITLSCRLRSDQSLSR